MTIRERLKELRENRNITRLNEDYYIWKKNLRRSLIKLLLFCICTQLFAAGFTLWLFTR